MAQLRAKPTPEMAPARRNRTRQHKHPMITRRLLHPLSTPKELHFLDATVSVGVHALDAEEDFTIVLGSDGFFDCFEYEQPVAMAHAHLRTGGRAVCSLLMEQMLANTTMVNMERRRKIVMVIALKITMKVLLIYFI